VTFVSSTFSTPGSSSRPCVFGQGSLPTSCLHSGFWRGRELDGRQGEAVGGPLADGTLVQLPVGPDYALMPSLLTRSDVMGTGHHATLAAILQSYPGVSLPVTQPLRTVTIPFLSSAALRHILEVCGADSPVWVCIVRHHTVQPPADDCAAVQAVDGCAHTTRRLR
jgi:hypothetical protein